MAHLNQDVIRDYFAKLNLTREMADIYLALHAYGPQTMSQLSRNALIERTRLYRVMDTMVASHLCTIEMHGGHTRVVPAPIGNVQLLIAEREQELDTLRDKFGYIEKILSDKKNTPSSAMRVQRYKGDAGLKQLLWNETRFNTESVSILAESMQLYTGENFFERWVRRCNERHMRSRSIVSERFLASLQVWYSTHQNERLDGWQGRYVPDSVFKMTRSMVVHDDVVAYYGWKAGEGFGIEIYDQELADTQRQFFEMLWAQGTDLTKDQAKPHFQES